MTRRQAYLLIAACVWTLYVWITRIVIISGQDESAGFKIVHTVLARDLDRVRAGDRPPGLACPALALRAATTGS